jgi:uncharacterized YccA/Bax inhibitor family protein
MPRSSETEKSLPNLFKQLGTDGLGVAEAELALARAELAGVLRGYVTGIILGVAGFAMTLTAMLVLAQAGAVALTPYVANPAIAYLGVGLVLAALAIVLALFASNWLTRRHRPIGLVFKWLLGKEIPK